MSHGKMIRLFRKPGGARSRAVRAGLGLLLLGLAAAGPARAASWGYMTNANGIHRINTLTGAATLLYNGGPFNGTTVAAGSAQRSTDGLLFFTFNNGNNNPVYRWDPANPATAPVLLGTTGAGVPYLHRLGFHPTTNVLYAFDINGTNLWTINQTTGVATNVATITGFPGNVSGDIAFDPGTNNLYAVPAVPVGGGVYQVRVYQLPLGGGPAVQTGVVTGIPSGINAVTSVMFDGAGTMFVGGSQTTNLYTAPVTGGAAVLIGNMGTGAHDYGSVPALPPTVAKAFAPTAVVPNTDSVLTLTLNNPYTQAVRGAAIIDTYPAGLVNGPTPTGATTCGGTVTAAAGGNSVSLSGGTIPAGGSCTVTVNVRSGASGSYANSVPTGALSTILGFNDNTANATLTVGTPSITLVKTSTVVSDPFNATTNPKRIPGAFVDYTITLNNTGSGPADNNTVILTDPIPANTDLYVNDLGGAGSGPVGFVPSTSGLSYTFTSLGSAADDVSFSNDGGASFTYTPVPNASGVDPAVTHIRINPKGTLNPSSNFQTNFRIRIE